MKEARTLILGDCLERMQSMDADSVDAIVTDPPYALTGSNCVYKFKRTGSGNFSEGREAKRRGFMGKEWDGILPGPDIWREALRVSKPGAHLLAFGGTRTFHRLTCAIEDAGWEIRDCLSWLYGQGFPKSLNGEWGGTALKPAWEPIVMARKPLVGTVAANVQRYGTGGINVDGCRIGTGGEAISTPQSNPANRGGASYGFRDGTADKMQAAQRESIERTNTLGRWPANLCLDEQAAAMLDEQSGERSGGAFPQAQKSHRASSYSVTGGSLSPARNMGDSGGASRFFYCAKASRGEREEGVTTDPVRRTDGREKDIDNPRLRTSPVANHHPTVKPLSLMRWLVRLVCPPGGIVLDPFMGSGTTGIAAHLEGCKFVGIEKEREYFDIATSRIGEMTRQEGLFT